MIRVAGTPILVHLPVVPSGTPAPKIKNRNRAAKIGLQRQEGTRVTCYPLQARHTHLDTFILIIKPITPIF